MNFELNDEQRMLQDSVARLLGERYRFEQRKAHAAAPDGWSREVWAQLAGLGLLALPFAEEDGGLGGGAVENLLLMEAFGRHLVLEPYFATAVLCANLLRHAAQPRQRQALAGPLMAGLAVWAWAHAERPARYELAHVETRARRTPTGFVIDGSKFLVMHGASADHWIVTARTHGDARDGHGLSLFLVDPDAPGVQCRRYRGQDGNGYAEIAFHQVAVDADALIGAEGQALPVIETVVDDAIVALCFEAVGAMRRLHEITVDYLKVRQQFGVAIGSFQALQHRAVDMLVMIEQSHSIALLAAMTSSLHDARQRRASVHAAKALVSRSSRWVGQQAIQLHGGIGMTEECEVGHYFRRLATIEMLFGDADHHLQRLARAGGLLAEERISS